MRTLSTASLLAIWEAGIRLEASVWALKLLAAVFPEKTQDNLLSLSIGERDYYLFQVRERLFGPRMTNITQCPRCNERLEWASEVAEYCSAAMAQYPAPEEISLLVDDQQIRFRLPNTRDMDNLSVQREGRSSQDYLLERCIIEATTSDGKSLSISQISQHATQEILQAMEQADPLARIDINLTCPVCEHQWQAIFDIPSFLWKEINAWAVSTLRTVAVLAKTYSWEEANILAMSPTRRQTYLEMAIQ